MKQMLLLLLGIALLLLPACSTEPETEHATEVQVTVVAEDLVFTPSQIFVKAGQTVRLTFENDGALLHDFSIAHIPLHGTVTMHTEAETHGADEEQHDDDLMDEMEEHNEHADDMAVHIAAAAGEHATIEFTPESTGVYTFVCTVDGHEEAGMIGEIIVES